MHVWVLLPKTVNTPHALFQESRIPGDIIVDHEPANLEIDALTSRIGRNQVFRATFGDRTTEECDLFFTLLVALPTMDLRNLVCKAEPLEASYQKFERVPVLGEDDQFVILVEWVT